MKATISTTYRNNIASSFFTRLGLRERGVALALLGLLAEHEEFGPCAYELGEQWVPVSGDAHDPLIEHWLTTNTVGIRNCTEPRVRLTLTMTHTASGGYNTSLLSVEERYFTRNEQVERFLALNIRLYNILRPAYGNIHQNLDAIEMSFFRDPRYGRIVAPVDLPRGLPGVYWANFFGPEYVDKVTKRKLFSAPCYTRRELSDGGILILISPSPLAPNTEPNRVAQARLRDHLGNELFYPSLQNR